MKPAVPYKAVPEFRRPMLYNVLVGCSDCSWRPPSPNGAPDHDRRPYARRHTVKTGHRTFAEMAFTQTWTRGPAARTAAKREER